MKKLVATLLALVMISTCSVGLASNSNISGFINNLLDALNNFNIDSQAMQGSIYEPTRGNPGGYHPASEMIGVDSQKIGSLILQKKGGMYQMRIHSDQMGNDVAALEFNDQLIRIQSVQESYDYSTRSTKRQTVAYELRYDDIQEMIDQAMSMLSMMGTIAGVDIDLDAIADIDFDAIADALVSFLNLVIQHAATTETDQTGNFVARICISELGVLEAADEWIDLFLNNKTWQKALTDMAGGIVNSFGSMLGNIDDSMSIIGDLNLGDMVSPSMLSDAVRQLREEQLRPMIQNSRANTQPVFDLRFAVASNGDFAYLTVDVGGGYGSTERFIDARYEGSDLILKLGTDGNEKVRITSTNASRIDMEYLNNGNVRWTGYATQSGSGNSWIFELYDTYTYNGSANSAPQRLLSLQTTGQQPFDSLADAPNLIRINWNWIMQNAFGSGARLY